MNSAVSSISDLGICSSTRILGVFPHPDDETAFAAGFFHQAVQAGATVHWFCATNGEKSTLRYGLTSQDDLATIRIQEMHKVAQLLHITALTMGNFPDGGLEKVCKAIKPQLSALISEFKPDILVTLEPDGIYGHPDHICLSNIIHDFYHFSDLSFQLIYATVPATYTVSDDVKHMAEKDIITPLPPTHVLYLDATSETIKRRAAKTHYSQLGENTSFWQLWEENQMFSREYFHLV